MESALKSMKKDRKDIIKFIQDLKDTFSVQVNETLTDAEEPRHTDGGEDDVDGTENNRETTELHLVARYGYDELVEVLYNCRQMELPNFEQDFPLHVAAKCKRYKTLKALVDVVFDKESDEKIHQIMNFQNGEGESVLHIAMKRGNAEVVRFLIKHGCHLEIRDYTGNTPLHDLVEKASQMNATEPYIEVWKAVAEEAKFWWMNKFNLREGNSKVGKAYEVDALYYVRSELRNKQGLTVLQYAVKKGLTTLVKAMLWENVFISSVPSESQRKKKNGCCRGTNPADKVKVLVTNLLPNVRHNKAKHCIGSNPKSLQPTFCDKTKSCSICEDLRDPKACRICNQHLKSNVSNDGNKMMFDEICDPYRDEHDKTLLDPFLKISPPNKAAEVMAIEPLNTLIKDYWFVRQWFKVVMMILHMIHMGFYTYYVVKTVARSYQAPYIASHVAHLTSSTLGFAGNLSEIEKPYNISKGLELEPNYLYLMWPIAMLVPLVVGLLYVGHNLCRVCGSGCQKFNAKGLLSMVQRNYEVESYIDLKDFFKLPSLLLSVISALLPVLLPIFFFAFTLASLLVTSEHDTTFFTNTLIGSVFIGWLMTFYWTSSFEPVYRFTTALHHIILKDVLSFLVFYIFVLLAFASGMFVLFEMVPELTEQYPTFNSILYALFLKGTFAGSRISPEEVSKKLEQAGHSTVMFDFLFTSFIITTRMLFLNMITSTMMSTYRDFVGTTHNGWLQYSLQVNNSYFLNLIARRILHPIFKMLGLIDRKVHQEENEHYYIEISKDYHKLNKLQSVDVKICQACRCSSIDHDAKVAGAAKQNSEGPNSQNVIGPHVISGYYLPRNHDETDPFRRYDGSQPVKHCQSCRCSFINDERLANNASKQILEEVPKPPIAYEQNAQDGNDVLRGSEETDQPGQSGADVSKLQTQNELNSSRSWFPFWPSK